MNIAIVYESSTGTTTCAAEAKGSVLKERGHQRHVQRIVEADVMGHIAG